MSRSNFHALLKATNPLSEDERTALTAALMQIPNADVGELTEIEALGMTRNEMMLTVMLSIGANFATDAIKTAIDASGLTDKVILQAVLPAPAEPDTAPRTPKAAPPRQED